MVKQYLSFALLGATLISALSCNAQNGGFKTTKDGLQYKIVKDAHSPKKAALGDYLEFHIKSTVHDSMLYDSRQANRDQPVPFQVQKASFHGDLMEGFMLLGAGDSAIFRVPVDSIIKAGNQPVPWMQPGKRQYVQYNVNLVSVKTPQQYMADQKAAGEKQKGIDETTIQKYLADNHITATRTNDGLYYKVDKMGSGPKPVQGDSVKMNYTGTTLDGKKFDSNVDPQFQHVQPFWFNIGMHQVIPGWDEGIMLMPQGSKGTLYIPSGLAYGAQSPSPAIGPNSVLVFDVEVAEVKHSAAKMQAPMQMQTK